MENPAAAEQRTAYEQFDQPVPHSLWPPELLPGAEEWLSAFWELNTDRPIGMGQGAIPSASIARLAVDMLDGDMFAIVIRAMDRAYLDHVNSDGKPQSFSREVFRAAMV